MRSSRRRVRLWFGGYRIAEFVGEPAVAVRYEAKMRRRFPGLEVTNEVLPVNADPVDYSPADLHR
ncbi:hypothetical protein FB475_1994 [Kribbella jejuensis]|uniref:Uncharacterized protein n=1 Tax=Kribbella jejuensis TaxID=236068 RepID=A0A542ERB7_9ACTN|nr:hypothetical protein FB475_1994 [Kribbella jejuensis]